MSNDLQQEFAELSTVQDEKLKVQENDFSQLKDAESKMVKEALDILTIAKSTDNPRQTILKAIAEYAKAKNIPVLGAKVEVLQYLSPEWKKEVDREVRKYLAQNNLFEIVQLPQGDPRRTEYIENLKILNQEGYADYLVFAIHHVDKPKQIEGILIYHERFLANIKKEFEQENKDQSFSEKEKYVFGNSFPEAKKYFEDLKIKSPNDYNYAIKIAWQNLFFACSETCNHSRSVPAARFLLPRFLSPFLLLSICFFDSCRLVSL